MHIKIVTFRLREMDEAGYRAVCSELAPAFAEVPGLLTKIWLGDPAGNTYGGVYLFRDVESAEAYGASELMAGVAASSRFADVTVRDFGVYEDLTAVTQPGLEIVSGVTG
jgi:hypothetical protein